MESYDIWIVVLLAVALGLKYGPDYLSGAASTAKLSDCLQQEAASSHSAGPDASKLREFASFQRWYIVVFLLVMLADWMQGPYVYKLYAAYSIPTHSIAVLFIIGFGASGISGTFIGSLADKFGRKNMCCAFCVFYISCCATKHFHSFRTLLVGRVLGGISTSILFSCFESWMVTHHKAKGFPLSKLGDTFGRAWALNSFVAILAGVITSYAVAYYELHHIIEDGPSEIAAFDCSAVTLLIAGCVIRWKWGEENFGDANIALTESLSNAAALFRSDRRILLIGVLQSGFESAMYLFVFLWTMALESGRGGVAIDHGLIFAVFMESCLIGTTLSGLLSKHGLRAERVASFLAATAAAALFVVPQVESYEVRLFMFIVFECCVGVYFPTIGGLRGKYVPDAVRATIMNIFRIPLNVIVVTVLYSLDALGMYYCFLLASALLIVASLAGWKLAACKMDEKMDEEELGGALLQSDGSESK